MYERKLRVGGCLQATIFGGKWPETPWSNQKSSPNYWIGAIFTLQSPDEGGVLQSAQNLKNYIGLNLQNQCYTTSFLSAPLPSIGSHIGVKMAAGWIELQRISYPFSQQ